MPQLGGLGDFGGLNDYKPGAGLPEGLKFERGNWYYVEQEYKSESSVGASDGAYRLWFAKSGEETTTPLVELTGIPLPPIRGGSGSHMSLWGNFGHDKNTYGAWYIDDLVISNTKIGPLDRRLISNNNSFPSKAPR